MSVIHFEDILEVDTFATVKITLNYLIDVLKISKQEATQKVTKFYTDHGSIIFDEHNEELCTFAVQRLTI